MLIFYEERCVKVPTRVISAVYNKLNNERTLFQSG